MIFKNFLLPVLVLSMIVSVSAVAKSKTITFTFTDDLKVSADLYIANPEDAPFIILFHQAMWSRGEYLEIAPKLNRMGFNCMAVDQRSGGEVNGIINETYQRAKAKNKGTDYIDAYPDMEGALLYVRQRFPKSKIIVWGSSYSSSLVFRLAATHPDKVSGLLSFAPRESFEKKVGKKNYITDFAAIVQCPVFVTSAKREEGNWKGIFAAVKGKKASYLPETAGNHGSRALWEKFSDHKGYWEAVNKFLKQFQAK